MFAKKALINKTKQVLLSLFKIKYDLEYTSYNWFIIDLITDCFKKGPSPSKEGQSTDPPPTLHHDTFNHQNIRHFDNE